ncbi:hypothetical protein HAX54_013568 [Datura stramonium]|uniref:Uncharacterized protein n=1 Tax=Datura stramonium TaxID=4076 RepID=A0ABS8RYD7_DATST|nr:hypothetical protein [Datura stramonium]
MSVCDHQRMINIILIIFVLLSNTTRRMDSIRVVESIRVMKEKLDYERLLQNQLPRGPVPPSDPSPCHNRLNPTFTKFNFPQDYIICP